MTKSIRDKVQETITANAAKAQATVKTVRAAVHKATLPEAPVAVKAQTKAAEFIGDVDGLFKKYSIVLPSGTRMALGLVASLTLGCGIGYLGGSVLAYLVVGALVLTGSAFISLLVYALGVLMIIATCWYSSGLVSDFILSGDIDRCYQKYSDKVGNAVGQVLGYFDFSSKVAAS
jgi:hypothetical protein